MAILNLKIVISLLILYIDDNYMIFIKFILYNIKECI
jgi:hypothetical protein